MLRPQAQVEKADVHGGSSQEPQEQAEAEEQAPDSLLQTAWSTLTSMFRPQAWCEVESLPWRRLRRWRRVRTGAFGLINRPWLDS